MCRLSEARAVQILCAVCRGFYRHHDQYGDGIFFPHVKTEQEMKQSSIQATRKTTTVATADAEHLLAVGGKSTPKTEEKIDQQAGRRLPIRPDTPPKKII